MIYLDNIIYSLQNSGGISVVWSEMLKGIINSSFQYHCLEYNNAENNSFRKKLKIPSSNIDNKEYRMLSIQRYFNPKVKRLNSKQPFIFHSSYYRYSTQKNAINFTTVHDFTYEYYSRRLKKIIHCFQKYESIKHSDYIICISETTKKDLLHFIPGVNEDKIHVIYNGVSDSYKPIINCSKLKNKFGDFILFIGSRASYKNFNLAIAALKQTTLNLVIVGSQLSDYERSYIEKELGVDRFYELGILSNEELNQIYNQAYCLLYPSSYEGFGIPVIEAQRAGCPVVVLNTPSIVEIIGDRSLVSSTDINSILEKIYALKDKSLRESVIRKGLENSTKYSWDTMREQLINLYQDAFESIK